MCVYACVIASGCGTKQLYSFEFPGSQWSAENQQMPLAIISDGKQNEATIILNLTWLNSQNRDCNSLGINLLFHSDNNSLIVHVTVQDAAVMALCEHFFGWACASMHVVFCTSAAFITLTHRLCLSNLFCAQWGLVTETVFWDWDRNTKNTSFRSMTAEGQSTSAPSDIWHCAAHLNLKCLSFSTTPTDSTDYEKFWSATLSSLGWQSRRAERGQPGGVGRGTDDSFILDKNLPPSLRWADAATFTKECFECSFVLTAIRLHNAAQSISLLLHWHSLLLL